MIPAWALIISGCLQMFRANSGPAARGGERIRLAVVLGRGMGAMGCDRPSTAGGQVISMLGF